MILSNYDLACQPTAVPRARTWLSRTLDGYADGADCESVVADAVLCVSELVTNALRAECSLISLCVELDAGVLRISVVDDAAGTPMVRHPGSSDPHGRGLLIVSAMATAWGVNAVESGKQVWAELAWPG